MAQRGLVLGAVKRRQPETRSHLKLRLGQDGSQALWWSSASTDPSVPAAFSSLEAGDRWGTPGRWTREQRPVGPLCRAVYRNGLAEP